MKRIFVFLLVFLPVFVMAQESVGFTADRPGSTTSVDVLPRGRVQWETGIGWERSKHLDHEYFLAALGHFQ